MQNKILKIKNKKIGFTLIELLIVIAILGILAIGLLVALDPLEQIKKGQDTTNRDIATNFYNAALAYSGSKMKFPWGTTAQTVIALNGLTGTYIQSLISAGELKAGFANNTARLAKIFITSTHPGISANMDDLAVCFAPESKAVQGDENNKYNATGGVNALCTAGYSPATLTCYWCAK